MTTTQPTATEPTLDSDEAVNREIRWVAREAIVLHADRDPDRRARFLERKRALLAAVEEAACSSSS